MQQNVNELNVHLRQTYSASAEKDVKVCVCVSVCALTRSNGRHREDPVSNKLAIFFKHCYPQGGQCREDHLERDGCLWEKFREHVKVKQGSYDDGYVCKSYLVKHKHFIVPHRVQGVPIGCFGSVLPLCISRKSKHVHFHVHAHLFIRQELAWDHLVDVFIKHDI